MNILWFRFRILNQKGTLGFNSVSYFHEKKTEAWGSQLNLLMFKHLVSDRIKTRTDRRYIPNDLVVSVAEKASPAYCLPFSFFISFSF